MEPLKNMLPFVRPVPFGPPPVEEPAQAWCDTCKGRRFVNGGFVNNRTIVKPCPTCSGSTRTRVASKEQVELVAQVFGGSQIPPEMHDWTFDTYPPDGDRAAHARVQGFVAGQLAAPGGQRGLYMGGKLGTGKTGLAVSLLHAAIDAQKTCLFFNEAVLFKRLRATMGGRGRETEGDVLSIVTSVPWLVLDDVGVLKPSEYVIENYYYIVEERLNHGYHTVFTSNFSTIELEKRWRSDTGMSGVFHQCDRILDRMRSYCVGVSMQGKNLRKGK
jgi:DNA replication protein DnaC